MSFETDKGAFISFPLMQTTNMYIHLKGVRLYAYHGVDPQETKVGAYFIIDLKLKTDFSHASQTDELEGTVSYADIYQVLKEEMQTSSKLLEHACQRISERIFHDFPTIEELEIKLFKENPPMGAQAERVGVEMCCKQ